MAEDGSRHKRHFLLENTITSEPFRPRSGGDSAEVPSRNRQQHGGQLLQQLGALRPEIEQARSQQKSAGLDEGFGLQVEFESFPDIELAFESLAKERSGIELLNVRHEESQTMAAIFVPDGKLHILENLVAAYLDESKDSINEKKGTRKPRNQKLLDAIRSIRVASLKSLWTDEPKVFPQSDDETFWWEVWLPVRGDRIAEVQRFKQLAEGLDFRAAPGQIEFPERTVLLMYGSRAQMRRSMMTLNSIAELRRAKETADFFDSLSLDKEPEWSDNLLQRLNLPVEGADVPHVCVLDTGVNHGHPLLASALGSSDLHTIDPGWGTNDNQGHGTEMAGLALLGDLTPMLVSSNPVSIHHRLESVKLLDRNHSNGGNAEYHGYLTIQAVSHPEITAPDRQRVFSMAITARDARDRGRPSAWSATIDRLAVDYENMGETHRLFILSAGNVDDPNAWAQYPHSNSTDGIHDPGQAWNALTVGASTELVHITEPDTDDYQPIAPAGGLSPFSTTSQTWQSHWPLKPDVVFEGGNAAKDAVGAVWMPSLSLLTTNADTSQRLFTATNATSAASALAARMTALLMVEYPKLRAETIRGLMVHSAEWTPAMLNTFLATPANSNKGEIANLVRHCGFGQPDMERALWSVENSLTLICEESLRPFKREGSKAPTLRDMNLHRLPWPLKELEALGETQVKMRVTISYFIEPNPSARGVTSRYRYESHGLRFEVKRPYESEEEFRVRINLAARDEEEQTYTGSGDDPNWQLGTRNRHKGSLHSDIWVGTAVDLASRGVLAVYPVTGWWKTRHKLERYNQTAQYSLIVSIHAPEVDVELYSAIENMLVTQVEV
jgi:hypothetical protein